MRLCRRSLCKRRGDELRRRLALELSTALPSGVSRTCLPRRPHRIGERVNVPSEGALSGPRPSFALQTPPRRDFVASDAAASSPPPRRASPAAAAASASGGRPRRGATRRLLSGDPRPSRGRPAAPHGRPRAATPTEATTAAAVAWARPRRRTPLPLPPRGLVRNDIPHGIPRPRPRGRRPSSSAAAPWPRSRKQPPLPLPLLAPAPAPRPPRSRPHRHLPRSSRRCCGGRPAPHFPKASAGEMPWFPRRRPSRRLVSAAEAAPRPRGGAARPAVGRRSSSAVETSPRPSRGRPSVRGSDGGNLPAPPEKVASPTRRKSIGEGRGGGGAP